MHPAIAKAKQAAAMTSLAESNAEILPRLDRIESALALLAATMAEPARFTAPAPNAGPDGARVESELKSLREDVGRILTTLTELAGINPTALVAPDAEAPTTAEAGETPAAADHPLADGRAQEPAARHQGGRNRR